MIFSIKANLLFEKLIKKIMLITGKVLSLQYDFRIIVRKTLAVGCNTQINETSDAFCDAVRNDYDCSAD